MRDKDGVAAARGPVVMGGRGRTVGILGTTDEGKAVRGRAITLAVGSEPGGVTDWAIFAVACWAILLSRLSNSSLFTCCPGNDDIADDARDNFDALAPDR